VLVSTQEVGYKVHKVKRIKTFCSVFRNVWLAMMTSGFTYLKDEHHGCDENAGGFTPGTGRD
jgi:hypothetical protein